ncbi:MAG: exonuclease [Candidatus Electrothrix sp. AUS3]|nr:exonuclease [Candidatus Electrothrix gigas]
MKKLQQIDKRGTNPFSNTRVDSPFQRHADLDDIHHDAFLRLTNLLDEIKADSNQQSQGAVVLGVAGNGKTHLMMRLAQRTLKKNRLFFVRQPNHEEAVFYHIYSRILESFIEQIPDTEYSQLEYLLGCSFAKIVIKTLENRAKPSKKGLKILQSLSQDPLNIYNVLGKEGTKTKRSNWDYIERETLQWWQKEHGFSDYASKIVVGLIRYCRYSDPKKKELVRRWLAGHQLLESEIQAVRLHNWQEKVSQEEFVLEKELSQEECVLEKELSREEFALQAMVVFGKLSVEDEPLIIVFDQLEGLKYNEKLLVCFGEAVKEMFTHVPNCLMLFNLFPDRWRFFQQIFDASVIERMGQHQIPLEMPSKEVMKKMLDLKLAEVELDNASLFEPEELEVILSYHSIRGVLNCAADYYRYKVEGVPLPTNTLGFEARVDRTLQELRQEIAVLRQHLDLKPNNKPGDSTINPGPPEVDNYIQQKREQLTTAYTKKHIISDTDDLGKLLLILDALRPLYGFQLDYLRLGKRKLPEHVVVDQQQKKECKERGDRPKKAVVAFLHADAFAFASRIKNFNQLVVQHKDIGFALFRDTREPKITGKVSKGEIEKLNNTENGRFIYMDRSQRIHFELIYQIISDIQNHDLHAELDQVMPLLGETIGKDFWLFRAIGYY